MRNTVSFDSEQVARGTFQALNTSECSGPIVRICPNELHVKDVYFHDTLYSLGVKRNKVPYMIDIFGTTLASKSSVLISCQWRSYGYAVFGTEQHDLHRSRRAALNPFFSKRSVARLESVIQSKVCKMCDRLVDYGKEGKILTIQHALTSCIVDITTEYCTLHKWITLAYWTCPLGSADAVNSIRQVRERPGRSELFARMGRDDARGLGDCASGKNFPGHRANRTTIAYPSGQIAQSIDGEVLRVRKSKHYFLCHPCPAMDRSGFAQRKLNKPDRFRSYRDLMYKRYSTATVPRTPNLVAILPQTSRREIATTQSN